jgi:hypothetical protein
MQKSPRKRARRAVPSLFSGKVFSQAGLLLISMLAVLLAAGTIAWANFDFRSEASTASTAADPIKIAFFYKPPTNLSTTQLAAQVDTMVLTRKDEAAVLEAKAVGVTEPILQYLIFDSIQGPSGLTNNLSGPCSSTQLAFVPRSNQVANETGEFCQLHNSITTGQAFDHDLDPQTPAVVATENWFLHNQLGQRLGNFGGNGFYYHINHAQQPVREYFLARALRELKGTTLHPKTGMDGIFLDNIELSWNKKLSRLDVSGQPVEAISSAQWAAAVRDSVNLVSQGLHANSFPLWGNMIENPKLGGDWNAYATLLDGGMEESFALDWNGEPRSAAEWELQLQQAESWMAAGRTYLAVSQGSDSAAQARFGLASLLLVTDGEHGLYRHSDSSVYTQFWQYPEYEYQLGAPLAARYQDTSTADTVWKRQFSCGQVSVNLTTGVGTIEVAANCAQPSASPVSSPSPSSTISPSPTPQLSPSPSPSPSCTTVEQCKGNKCKMVTVCGSPAPSPSPSSSPKGRPGR